ncbi:MAG: hypothetical protein J0M00_25235 [Burkholderiales bacterium]|nr:hypothetical protein [Burkholderiales bacterium]
MGAFPGFLLRKASTPAANTYQPISRRLFAIATSNGSMEHEDLTLNGDEPSAGSNFYPNWVSGASYTANSSIVRRNGAQWHCAVSNNDTVFDEAKWHELRPLSYFAAGWFDPRKRSSGKTAADVYDTLRADNPAIRLHAYCYVTAAYDGTSDSFGIPAKAWLDANNGWLYSVAGGSGASNLVANVRNAAVKSVNITTWGPRDSDGLTFAEWNAAQHAVDADWAGRRWNWAVDDSHSDVARATADGDYFNQAVFPVNAQGTGYWDTVSSTTSTANLAAIQDGIRAYFNALRRFNPGTKVISNQGPQGKQPASWRQAAADHYLLEGTLGADYAPEHAYDNAWLQQFIYELPQHVYPTAKSRSMPVWISCKPFDKAATPATQPFRQDILYALSTVLLTEGLFCWTDDSLAVGARSRRYIPEYDWQIGVPIEGQPTAAWSDGIWKREYKAGLVLVYPRLDKDAGWDAAPDKVVTLPAGSWLDAAGQPVTQITMKVRSGAILRRA